MLIGGNVRIFVAFEPVDMRLSLDGLAAKVQHALQLNPYGGECFVFRSRSGERIKILYWDGVGFWLWYRRLEHGSFIWPAISERGVLELTQGLDWRRVRFAQQWHPSVA
jgi:transposase